MTVIYLLIAKKLLNLKPKILKLEANPLSLGSISTGFNLPSSDIEDSKVYGNVYDFSVDYSAISNDKIHDIHAYLMRKNGKI